MTVLEAVRGIDRIGAMAEVEAHDDQTNTENESHRQGTNDLRIVPKETEIFTATIATKSATGGGSCPYVSFGVHFTRIWGLVIYLDMGSGTNVTHLGDRSERSAGL